MRLKSAIISSVALMLGMIQLNVACKSPATNHSYVDLGLPSGTLWATCNIGAAKPEEIGDLFAWGETESKDLYDWSTYKWGDDEMTKYNSKDTLTTLLAEDDAATVGWGSDWRMPTTEEYQELIKNCRYELTEVGGVSGAKFTASNGSSIFLPLAGGYYDFYWSSSLSEESENLARGLNFNEFEAHWYGYYRYLGSHVRAVRAKKAERKTYSVKFYTSDSTLIESQNVVEGMSAKEVKAPERNGYDFVGWSAATDSVVSNMSVYTLYKELPASSHSYVDLCLPSGTLWATCNIGATKPEELGDYFAWGETSPKEVYGWTTYKWGDDEVTKYNSKDNLTTLLAEDDAATANWGSDWRMPTTEEQQELIDNCQREWTEVNGVSGAKFTGSNGNSIFLPAAGYRDGSDVNSVGDYGLYWSSSLSEEYEDDARSLDFREDEAYWNSHSRWSGFPVRAVRAKK